MTVRFHDKLQESDEIYSFRFAPERPIAFVAGQFIELTLPHDEPDDRGIKRWFTISSAPSDPFITITTRITQNSSTFMQALQTLRPGTSLHMTEPMGDFVLPLDPSIPLVFVAVGIGITPFHSMLAWLADTDAPKRNIQLLYGVKNEDDIIFQDTFEHAKVHATIVVKDASAEWGGERGELTSDHIVKLAEMNNQSLVYVAGPEPVVESLQTGLVALGIKRHHIVTDFFLNYGTI